LVPLEKSNRGTLRWRTKKSPQFNRSRPQTNRQESLDGKKGESATPNTLLRGAAKGNRRMTEF